jgi:hypothetical protein
VVHAWFCPTTRFMDRPDRRVSGTLVRLLLHCGNPGGASARGLRRQRPGLSLLDKPHPSWICSQLLSQSHFRLSDASLGGLLHDQRQSFALDDGRLREGVLAERRRSRRLGTPGGWPTPKVREVLGLTHLRVRRTCLLQSHNRDTQRWAQHVIVADESASSPERPVRSPYCSRPPVRGHLGPSRAGRCCPTPGHTTRLGQQAQKSRSGGRQFRSVYEAV